MQYTYKIIQTLGDAEVILRSDDAFIPKNLANIDYQEYLKSLDEASTL